MFKYSFIFILIFISFNLNAKETFLKCNYSGEYFEPSKEAIKKFTLKKRKIIIGVPSLLISLNLKDKTMTITDSDSSKKLPINFEDDFFYMHTESNQSEDPKNWGPNIIESDNSFIDIAILFMNYKEEFNLNVFPFVEFIQSGISFDSYERLRVHFYISINKFDLKLKILHQIDGLEFNSVNSEIIGSYSSKFVCKIIEKKL